MTFNFKQLISLIYGGDFNIFRPKTARHSDEDYNVEVVMSQYRYFGPFLPKTERLSMMRLASLS